MNDKRRPARNAAANSAAEDVSSVRGRWAPRGHTPLQEATVALHDLVLDMRDELSQEAYSWFIAIGTEVFGLEAARLFVGEALRAAKGEERRAA